jgi:hypothetical protein
MKKLNAAVHDWHDEIKSGTDRRNYEVYDKEVLT